MTNFRKNMRKKITAITVLGMTTVGAIEASYAEYFVSAFDHGKAFDQLMEGDIGAASAELQDRKAKRVSYADGNNLCVSQILSADYGAAIDSCEEAIRKTPRVTIHNTHNFKADIYSNLAVAKAMMGDNEGALADLKLSLSLNRKNENAIKNYDRLLSFQLAD